MAVQLDPAICWDCKNACGGCSWSDNLVPVDGWRAIETVDAYGEPGYRVRRCPEYVEDDRRTRPELDDQGCVEMVAACLELARKDYILGGEEAEEDIERFIRGRGASKVHRISNPEEVIRSLKEDKKKFWEEKRNEQADDYREPHRRS